MISFLFSLFLLYHVRQKSVQFSIDNPGDVINYDAVFQATKAISNCNIEFKKMDKSKKGYFVPKTNSIYLNIGMSDVQTIKTLFHEVGHSVLHNNNDTARDVEEVQAESVAFILSDHFGIDTSDYSFSYIADWGNEMSLEQIQTHLQSIQVATNNLISSIDDSIVKIKTLDSQRQPVSVSTLEQRLSIAKVITQEKLVVKEECKNEQSFNFKRG